MLEALVNHIGEFLNDSSPDVDAKRSMLGAIRTILKEEPVRAPDAPEEPLTGPEQMLMDRFIARLVYLGFQDKNLELRFSGEITLKALMGSYPALIPKIYEAAKGVIERDVGSWRNRRDALLFFRTIIEAGAPAIVVSRIAAFSRTNKLECAPYILSLAEKSLRSAVKGRAGSFPGERPKEP